MTVGEITRTTCSEPLSKTKTLLIKLLLYSILLILVVNCTPGPRQAGEHKADSISAHISTPVPDTTPAIEHIKGVYAAINKDKLTQKSFNWEPDTSCQAPPMGGTITYFLKGSDIVKLTNIGAEDHGSWKEEYYFENNRLVFVYQDNAYGGAANPDQFPYQNRYYFTNDQLIGKIESDSSMQLDTTAIREMVKTIYRLKQANNSAAISRIFSCDPPE